MNQDSMLASNSAMPARHGALPDNTNAPGHRRMTRPMTKKLQRVVLLIGLNLVVRNLAVAQPLSQVGQVGRHYFAVENVDRNEIELRGRAGSDGIAFPSDLILAPDTTYRAWILQAATLRVGFAEFTTTDSGGRVEVPTIYVWP